MVKKPLCAALVAAVLLVFPILVIAQDTDGDLRPDADELLHPGLIVSITDGGNDDDTDAMTSLEEYQYSPLLDPCLAGISKGGRR